MVGDSPTARKLVGLALANAGYAVREAAGGEALAEVDRRGPPDVAFVDEQLAGADAVGLCQFLRERGAAVVVAGRGGYFGRKRARRAGAVGYLTRPFRPEELLAALAGK